MEKKNMAADMLSKVKNLYEQTCVRLLSVRANKVSERWEKIKELLDKVEASDLELQTMQRLAGEATKLQNKVAELWKAVAKDGANGVVTDSLRNEGSKANAAGA